MALAFAQLVGADGAVEMLGDGDVGYVVVARLGSDGQDVLVPTVGGWRAGGEAAGVVADVGHAVAVERPPDGKQYIPGVELEFALPGPRALVESLYPFQMDGIGLRPVGDG